MAEHSVHSVAKAGFGTGTNELYDRARPSYQAAALSHIRNTLPASAPLNIVEIGAGTGIFTRALLAHPDWSQSVNQFRAIEPSEGMRDVFAKSVRDPRVSVADGTFDSTGVDDGWADVVVIAQAFHWCPDYDKASAEFARILKPTGTLAFIWNLENRDGAGWVAQLRERIERHGQGAPQFRLGLWRAIFATPSYSALFAPPLERTWSYALSGTRALVLDRAQSHSFIAILPEHDKAAVVRDISAILDRADRLVWLDRKAGVFEYPYQTLVVVARKK
ncbi:S-adenosyl-L-methionine-dependent methyltransferase [Sparassis latifolia]